MILVDHGLARRPRYFEPRRFYLVIATVLAIANCPRTAPASGGDDIRWWDGFTRPGTNRQVVAVQEWDGKLFVGGSFTEAGNAPASKIAAWDGASWSALGSGITTEFVSPGVNDLEVYDGALIAAGSFQSAGGTPVRNIARWDGTTWTPVGTGTNAQIHKLAVYDGHLIAVGDFTEAGGVSASHVAQWNGSAWSALGSGITGGGGAFVSEIAIDQNTVVVGGTFDTAGGVSAIGLARWNGTAWSAIGNENHNGILAIASYQGLLIISHDIWLRQWDGLAWSDMPNPGGYSVGTLLSLGTDLYADGPGYPNSSISRWDGATWTGIGEPMSTGIDEIGTYGGALIVGGWFAAGFEGTFYHVARWTGSEWAALGEGAGLDFDVNALSSHGGQLFAAGQFYYAGGLGNDYIAAWDGSRWNGSADLNGIARALYSDGTYLYCGGDFIELWGSPFNAIARSADGVTWDDMDGGIPSSGAKFDFPVVNAITGYAGGIVAGGTFQYNGDSESILHWDGDAWAAISQFAPPSDGRVQALATYQGDLYVGGWFYDFTTGIGNLARWDGSAWSGLGSGVNDEVRALTVHDGALIAAGQFTMAGGSAAGRVAAWDGVAWSALGTGMNSDVLALAVHDGELYAGGAFTEADGAPAACIARWDGAGWSPLGSGITPHPDWPNPMVFSLASHDGSLYAGGRFARAGEKPSFFIARWDPAGTPVEGGTVLAPSDLRLFQRGPNPAVSMVSLEYDLPYAGPISLSLYDVSGRLVSTLYRGYRASGRHHAAWPLVDPAGRRVPPNVYFARLEAGTASASLKLIVIDR